MSRQFVIQELQKPGTYLFKTYKQDLSGAGVDESDSLVATLNILISETFSTFSEKNLKMDSKYIRKLKILSILSCFFGKRTISLTQLETQLECNRQECLSLIVQASIYKLLTVKIDQASDIIHIEKAKIRQREAMGEIDKYLAAKLIRIKEKNMVLEQSLKQILQQIGVRPKQAEYNPDGFDRATFLGKKASDTTRY